MRILTLKQGSAEWHAHRASHWNASDAPAMLGESPYMSRTDLLHRMATGIAPDHDAATQRRFDDGHAVEALLRPLGEQRLEEPLHQFVAVAGFDERYSASFDGCTFVGDTTLECKLLNKRLRAAFADMETIAPEHRERSACKCLPIDYRIQLEQQVRVAEADRALFMTGELRSDGTLGDVLSCWYYPDDALWARIQAGWPVFEEERASYVPPEVIEKATAAPIEALPAISARIMGELTISSNLPAFGDALKAFVARIPAKPSSEQEFADAEAACKALKKAEEALDGAEANALGQVQSVEVLTRTIGDLRTVARNARLATEKLVKARKEQIRIEECQRGKRALDAHVQGLNEQIGAAYMPAIVADFGAAISGVKTIDSLRARVDQLIADKKIEANEIAGRITVNLRTYRAHEDYAALFPDLKQIVSKTSDDFQALVQSRVLAHQAEEKRRAEALAEKERERIRREEQERAEREAREKLQREQQSSQPIAAAPIASPAVVSKPAAANSLTVVPITRAPSLRIGEIANRLGFGITEQFLRQLGFAPATTQGASCLFHEESFDLICEALVAHVRTIQAKQHEAVAA